MIKHTITREQAEKLAQSLSIRTLRDYEPLTAEQKSTVFVQTFPTPKEFTFELCYGKESKIISRIVVNRKTQEVTIEVFLKKLKKE